MTIASLSLSKRIAWYVPTGAFLTLLPVLKYSQLWWQLPRDQKIALLIVAAAFGAACAASLLLDRELTWRSAGRAAVRGVAIVGLALLVYVGLGDDPPAYLMLPLFVALGIVVALATSPLARSWIPAIGLGALALGVIALSVRAVAGKVKEEERIASSYIPTAFYTVHVVSREGFVPAPATRGGGLDLLGDRVLLGTGDGYLYLLDVPEGANAPHVEKLNTRVPNNRDEFAAAFGGSPNAPLRSSEYSEEGPPRVQTWRFRVADVIVRNDGDRIQLFASHHWWKPDGECFVVRVSTLTTPAANFVDAIASSEWRTMYESKPCIPLKGPERKRGKNPFKGEEIGGRLALLDERTLLLTLGDQGFSGTESLQAFARDPNADYGKTIRIDLATGSHSIFTTGHRNPQGLYITREGQIWETEHGAQGGDEVNLLVERQDYGWPTVTYGTDYGSPIWPVSQSQGRHDGFHQPQLAFVPSIGISQIVRLEHNERFPIWQGNLIVGSLSTRALYRLVEVDGRIVVTEPMPLGKRVRDILELADGRVLVWTDDAALVTLEPASGDNGEMLFASQCSGCHSIVDGMSHRIGPDLHGIVGRRIASASGYGEYSSVMRSQQGTWTKERLDEFLRDPQGMMPGNSMGFAGVADAKQRAALIDYMDKARTR